LEPGKVRIIPLLLLLVIVVMGVGIFSAYVLLNWSINQFMYGTKAELNWFNVVFYNGLTFIVAALLALLFLNPIPGRSDLFDALNTIIATTTPDAETSTLRPSRVLWAFWQFFKWVLAFTTFVNSNGIPGLGNLVMAISMMNGGFGDWGLVPRIFLSPVQPLGATDLIAAMPTMEVQYRILIDVVILILAILAIRLFLRFVKSLSRAQVGSALRSLFLCLACIVAAILPGTAYWAMDVTTPFAFMALSTILVSLVVAGIVSKMGGQQREAFTKGRRSATIIVAIGLLIILLANIGLIGWYRLNWNNNWTQYEWQPLIMKQIAVTRWAAGIEDVQSSPLAALPAGNISTILSLVRQWDQSAASTKMKNQIGVNWMTLSDTYIVYINGKEYWVGPTTVLYPSDDWISHHLIYTHASRIIVIDSHTGDYVSLGSAFGITYEPRIYYGAGMLDDVYVHVQGFSEIENASYVGKPDYVLSGWQRILWFLASGQVGFAFSPPQDIEMLYNRDLFNRVRGILISGLDVDPAAYLVTDGKRLYAAVQVFISYPLQSGFAASAYLRFFGVVLIDIENGEMQGYVVGNPKPGDFLTEFYRSYYGWKPPPDWLVPQLRYPEQLLGTQAAPVGQLDVDFMYHVNDPFVWRSGSDFYERPTATEVLYILHTVGNMPYFVGLQLVEYQASPGKNLAGLYFIYGGSRLGEIQLYASTPLANITTTQLIGPSAALQALETDDYVRTQLTLLTNNRLGNILLYSIGGKLYYFIPVYITTTVEGGVITKMAFMGVIDATTGTRVATGPDSLTAYYALTGGAPTTGAQQRLQRIVGLLASQGLNVVRSQSIMANVEVQVNQTNYITEDNWEGANSTILQFVKNYAQKGANTIYYWDVDSNNIGLGVFFSDRGVINLYYITIRYR
jgi:hypothetical protein